jgi:hypothetical protein
MTVSANHVYLYAATENDFTKCLAAADVSGIAYSHCIGSYAQAYELVHEGGNLVIAVGGAALYALYYNPCHWTNPGATAGGSTPFTVFPSGLGVNRTGSKEFVNAAGYTALDSLKLAVMMSYYAVYGTFPKGFQGLPRQEVPQMVCIHGASAQLSVLFPVSTSPTVPHPTHTTAADRVGVYASFTSATAVKNVLSFGWKGIAATAGLGTLNAPYTAELSERPDAFIGLALDNTAGDVFWLSFWTVSWPALGDTFYNAAFQAGKYVAERFAANPNKYLPNYIIIDPEGFNVPATTSVEWAEFIQGWAEGLRSVSTSLQSGFYCNQSQYSDYNLASINEPAFIAISPIEGNRPMVAGSNIEGYIAYYGTCPVAADISQVASWGGKFNTIQFRDSGVDCGPA